MLKDSPEGLKTLVLLEFTEKLIMHNSPMVFLKKIEKKETLALKKAKEQREKELEILEQEKKEMQEFIKKEAIKEKPKIEMPKGIIESKVSELKKTIELQELKKPFSSATQIRAPMPRTAPRPFLRIPETRLPLQFAHLKPQPKEIRMDLGKLNPLIDDPAVQIIESNGPDQRIIVRGSMGTKPTPIELTKEEINHIIFIFAKNAKIPVKRGVTEIALGKFVLTAIVSEDGSGFVIKKISQLAPPTPMGMQMPFSGGVPMPSRRF